MNTRQKVNLTGKQFKDLQLSFDRPQRTQSLSRSQSDCSLSSSAVLKQESVKTNSIPPEFISQVTLIMTETDDLRELEEIQQRQLQIEKKFLEQIPFFKSSIGFDYNEFLVQADDVFNNLKYTDDIRLGKIEGKLDDSLQSWFLGFKRNGSCTWKQFRLELSRLLQSSSMSLKLVDDEKLNDLRDYEPKDSDEKISVKDLIRRQVTSFSGQENALQWFRNLDSKFFELNLSFNDRLEILPHLFHGVAMIWFSLNQEKILRYTDFCQLFSLEYLKCESLVSNALRSDHENKSFFPFLKERVIWRKIAG